MRRIALVSSEPLRSHLAGIGIRYLELARRLPAFGFDLRVISPARPEETAELGIPIEMVAKFEAAHLPELLSGCAAVVAQGQLANDVAFAAGELPFVVDLYDPWLIENVHYHETLGLDPYRNDHASWVVQMSRGDYFLCSSEEQKRFYLGFLAALGRLNPERLASDPDAAGLLGIVPFGLPDELPPYQKLLPARAPGEQRLLFGGLYDWYDPWTLLRALERPGLERARLLFIRNPNPEATPQRLFAAVEAWCQDHGWWGTRALPLDWVPAERRFDLLREVDLLVSPHRPTVETMLSLRTRYLDALAAGCPAIATEGGTIGRLLHEADAGWVVPAGDPDAMAGALVAALDDEALRTARVARGRELAKQFSWERVLKPLVAFLRAPRRDQSQERFAFRPPTVAPPDGLGFRLRRWARRRLRHGQTGRS